MFCLISLRVIMKYTEFKREPISECNICQKIEKLTWNHVPPKGSIIVSPVEQQNIFNRFTVKPENRLFSISQNGVKFRTLCSVCNNKILGKKLDPILNDFSKQIASFVKSKLILPKIIDIKTRPTALVRAVLGHLLAAKAQIDNVKIDKIIRRFMFKFDSKIPKEINLFYWIYPYNNITIIRDVCMPAKRGNFKSFGIFSILKFFPIAFLLSDLQEYEGLRALTKYRDLKASETVTLRVDLRDIKHPDWPELIDTGNFIAGGQSFKSAVYASPRKDNR